VPSDAMTAYLDEHPEYRLCDECRHAADAHLLAWDYMPGSPARAYVFEHATCWAEDICPECDPEAHAAALALAPAPPLA